MAKVDTTLKFSPTPKWMSRVNGKPIKKPDPKKAFQPGAPIPKGVKMAPKPKANSYMGP